MLWRRNLCFAAVWLFVAASPLARAEDNTLQYQYLKIYLSINTADQLEKQGNYQGALTNFKDCYTRLQHIHNVDPNWESALVIQRMNDCRSKIVDLSSRLAEQVNSGAPETAPQNAEAGPVTTSPEYLALKQKLMDVQQELHDVQAKYANSQLEVQSLHTQLDSVNQELTALKSQQTGDNQMGSLLSQNKVLSDKLSEAEKEIASVKSLSPHSALSLMRTQLKNSQDQLAASEAANNALQQTTTTLRQQLDDAQADLHTANQRLAAVPANAPEYDTLKRENEVMREILTRELQEQAHRDMAKRLAQEEFDRLRITSKVLQEQLDILGSPMTPPTSDQERALLDGLRLATQVTPVPPEGGGNGFSAPASGNSTNFVNTPPPPAPENTAPTETPATTAATNEVAGGTTPPNTNAAPSEVATTANTNTPAASVPLTNEALVDANHDVPPVTPTPPTTVTPAGPPPMTNTDMATNTVSNPTPPAPSTETVAPTNSMASVPTTNSSPTDTNVATDVTPTNVTPAPASPSNTNTETTVETPTNASPATPPSVATTPANTPDNSTNTTAASVPPTTNAAPTEEGTQYSKLPRLPEDMRDTAQQAADLFKMQRYDDAAAKYQEIIDKYPESLYAWSNLGVVRFQQGKMPEALKALQRAVSLSPTDAFSYQNLGIVYYQMNQYENAISALERALALDPTNAKSHNYLGCACSQKGWSEVAEKEFLKAIEIDDTFGDAHFNLALVYATEKPPALEMARRHYKRALELGISPDPRLEKLLQMDGVAQNPPATAER